MALTQKTNPPLEGATKTATTKWGSTVSPLGGSRAPTFEPIRAPAVYIRAGATNPPLPTGASRPPLPAASRPTTRPPFAVVKSETLPPFPINLPSAGVAAPTDTFAAPLAPAAPDTDGPSAKPAPDSPSLGPVAITPTSAPFAPPTGGGIPSASPPPVGSSASLSPQTLVKFLKLCITATIILGGSYFAIKQAYPVLMELTQPGGSKLKGKDAPVGVQIIQQTRSVVALNDSNVARLNSIINDEFAVEKVALPALPASALGTRPKPVPAPEPVVKIDFKAINTSIDNLHIHGVVSGKEPRIIVGGLLVGIGSVVEPKFGLKFIGVDEDQHIVFLASEDGKIYRKHY